MIHKTGNQILHSLEKRFGGLALPQILRWVAGFQALSWGLGLFSPEFLGWITFERDAILSGQVWRLVSWALLPAGQNPLIVLIALLFLFFINDGLESEWSSFRLNVYVIATLMALSLIGLLPFYGGEGISYLMKTIFYSSVFLAFASLFPNRIIHLFAIIPIKAKWLGWLNAAVLGAIVLTSQPLILAALVVAWGMTPFLLVFVPTFLARAKERSSTAVRRHRFTAASEGEGEAFHVCESCGATDQSDPDRTFRVHSDGRELCDQCSPENSDDGK